MQTKNYTPELKIPQLLSIGSSRGHQDSFETLCCFPRFMVVTIHNLFDCINVYYE